MDKNTVVLIVAAGIFIVGAALPAVRKFRNGLFGAKGKDMVNYLSKLAGSIAAIVGVIIGVDFIVEVQPIFQNYTTMLQTKTNPIIKKDTAVIVHKDTVVIVHKDTVLIPKEVPSNKPDLTHEEYLRKSKQDIDDYVKQQKQTIDDYVNRKKSERDRYLEEQSKQIEEFLKNR